MIQINKSILKEIYKKRSKDSKKYDFGLLLVIGGSEFYTGSPALSAMAGFRAGVDMVHIVAPKRAADIIASFSPNLAAYPLKGDILTKEYLPTLLAMTRGAEEVSHGKMAVVIGGGLGRSEEVKETVLEYLSQISCRAVIDADAIHALAKDPEVAQGKNFLITPHGFEFFILTGKKILGLSDEEKLKLVRAEAERLKTTILLKGKIDLIAISDGKTIAINKTGTPFLTVGGTGDTLAGIAGALLARGTNVFRAGCAAAFINGLAGERVAKKFGESMTAIDLIKEIPNVLPKP